jgi:hypothetical protein
MEMKENDIKLKLNINTCVTYNTYCCTLLTLSPADVRTRHGSTPDIAHLLCQHHSKERDVMSGRIQVTGAGSGEDTQKRSW